MPIPQVVLELMWSAGQGPSACWGIVAPFGHFLSCWNSVLVEAWGSLRLWGGECPGQPGQCC